MGMPLTDWRLSIEGSLADGEWHELEPIIREASKKVPPGKAFRRAEAQRLRTRDAPRTRGDNSDVIQVGARSIVVESLNAARRGNRAEFKEEGGVRYVRDPKVAAQLALAKSDEEKEGVVASNKASSTVIPADDELLDELERQLVFWRRAFNMMGGDKDVRRVMIGDDPVERITSVLRRHGREC